MRKLDWGGMKLLRKLLTDSQALKEISSAHQSGSPLPINKTRSMDLSPAKSTTEKKNLTGYLELNQRPLLYWMLIYPLSKIRLWVECFYSKWLILKDLWLLRRPSPIMIKRILQMLRPNLARLIIQQVMAVFLSQLTLLASREEVSNCLGRN